MNKRILLIGIAAFFLFSCKSESGETFNSDNGNSKIIKVGPEFNYMLAENEQEEELTKDIVKEYELIINKYDDIQIPLSDYASSSIYSIYLGILIGSDYETLVEKFENDPDVHIYHKHKLDDGTDKYFIKSGDHYIYGMYHPNQAMKIKYLTHLSSSDSATVYEKYNSDHLLNNIE